ncbi:PhzF family phenazine biosynthesis protein [Aminobacter sp. MET-1]|uniref:PhzF family phenazine biosynthesis protein n=1 Tax=Aminobacter sp. MET-1 TaxID=2951085 RepID=UPI00226A6BD9|nr:PhzF family phenazine biosynthesis protein [Aminobacter sp. MET-1]MCX8571387.1 PhzF family phenazine biosynthesis protein [Aminobacter sp. MET-1]
MRSGRKYFIYDVFTEDRLAGNPLAVVVEANGLNTASMQAIAREFNLSETAFVLPPKTPTHKAKVRIFTPDYEMPFAGHPTVGTAIALTEMAQDSDLAGIFVLEENIGLVRCAVNKIGNSLFAEFDLPKLPEPLPLAASSDAVAAALGLSPHEIGFENHRVSLWSAGVPYITVPVADTKVAARIRFDNEAWFTFSPRKSDSAVASAYIYCRETVGHDNAFHARMIVPGSPSYEDPATGSAAAAFAGAIMQFDKPTDGVSRFWIEQGIEMGRPSKIRLELDVAAGNLVAARIGGHAVRVAEGAIFA